MNLATDTIAPASVVELDQVLSFLTAAADLANHEGVEALEPFVGVFADEVLNDGLFLLSAGYGPRVIETSIAEDTDDEPNLTQQLGGRALVAIYDGVEAPTIQMSLLVAAAGGWGHLPGAELPA